MWVKQPFSVAESELDFPRWASLCRQRDICPPVDVLAAGYLGWERPVRELSTTIDQAAEDAAFAEVMQGFSASDKQLFNASDLAGDH